MNAAIKCTAEQLRALAEVAYLGSGQLVGLGLPDQTASLVVHFESESIVIEEDGRVLISQRHWEPRVPA